MKKGTKAVFGIFDNRWAAEEGVDSLKDAGFRNDDVSVLMPNKKSTLDFAHEKSTKAPEGATTGAAGGVLLGGALGWLAGIGTLAIPGIGPFVAAGPIMAALAGAGAGGVIGGLGGALIGLGVPEYEAKRYEGMIKDGGILLSVHVDDSPWKKKAFEILKACGARDISSSTEESSAHSAKDNYPSNPPSLSESDYMGELMPHGGDIYKGPERRR
ncbi:MAG: DUF3341 domain-containing protein [Bdellovibrionota bacterium]